MKRGKNLYSFEAVGWWRRWWWQSRGICQRGRRAGTEKAHKEWNEWVEGLLWSFLAAFEWIIWSFLVLLENSGMLGSLKYMCNQQPHFNLKVFVEKLTKWRNFEKTLGSPLSLELKLFTFASQLKAKTISVMLCVRCEMYSSHLVCVSSRFVSSLKVWWISEKLWL